MFKNGTVLTTAERDTFRLHKLLPT
jgi:hypothetical protein